MPVSLLPLTAGREVVEDYRATQPTVREHSLVFLRGELTRRRIVRCVDLKQTKDGRRVHVAGIILVRRKPGSAKGCPIYQHPGRKRDHQHNSLARRFEAQRLVVMSSAMVSVTVVVQREGEVIHVIADRIHDQTAMLRVDRRHRSAARD